MVIYFNLTFSVGIEPIYPQVCQRISIMHQPNPIDAPISPIGLSKLLNSLPCCLSLNRQDPLPVYHLIMEVKKKLFLLICTIYTLDIIFRQDI